jgi:hypothetical protein
MRYLLLIISLITIFGGINDTYTSWKNPHPIPMTVEEFTQAKDKPVYVRLSDASFNLIDAVIVGRKTSGAEKGEQRIRKVTRLYIPIHSGSDSSEKQTIAILLDTQDDALLAAANEIQRLSEGEQLVYYAEHADELKMTKEVSGHVVSEATMNSDHREKIRSLKKNLAKKFFVLDDDSLPSIVRGISALGLGVFLLLLSLVLILRKRRKRALTRGQA